MQDLNSRNFTRKSNVDSTLDYYVTKEPIYPPLPQPRRVRKMHTPFYYQLLEQHGKQYTKKTKPAATLPDDWKALGIKQNQLPRRKSKR